jgi:hypothetical protein
VASTVLQVTAVSSFYKICPPNNSTRKTPSQLNAITGRKDEIFTRRRDKKIPFVTALVKNLGNLGLAFFPQYLKDRLLCCLFMQKNSEKQITRKDE